MRCCTFSLRVSRLPKPDGSVHCAAADTSNFALLGLHEAAAALGNATIAAEEDKLVDYIVRACGGVRAACGGSESTSMVLYSISVSGTPRAAAQWDWADLGEGHGLPEKAVQAVKKQKEKECQTTQSGEIKQQVVRFSH